MLALAEALLAIVVIAEGKSKPSKRGFTDAAWHGPRVVQLGGIIAIERRKIGIAPEAREVFAHAAIISADRRIGGAIRTIGGLCSRSASESASHVLRDCAIFS